MPSKIASVNPATEETLKTFDPISDEEVLDRLGKAQKAYKSWRTTPLQKRSAILKKVGEQLEKEQDSLGKTVTLEMGKPITASIQEVQKSAKAFHYYADNAERLLAPDEIETEEGVHNTVYYLPLGVVLAVMPWNFPIWQLARFAAPALTAGNAVVLKHASNVPQSALAMERILTEAGLPEGVFQTLLIGSSQVNKIIEDDRVVAVTVTGSTAVGAKVASKAGEHIKKSVLELGGSDPFIVMPSADLQAAVKTAVQARVVNTGQSCIAAKRFIVHESIVDEFTREFVKGMEALKIGDPMDKDTQIGPLSQEQGLKDITQQVEESVKAGAKLLTGGKRLDRKGFYYAPTVLTNIPKGCPADKDEIFGPVASIFSVPDLEAAIEKANDSVFGLGGAAWTRDDEEVRRFAEDVECGFLAINGMVASDPRLPMGGVKQSGYGRELGPLGIKEFVNAKTVHVKRMNEAPQQQGGGQPQAVAE